MKYVFIPTFVAVLFLLIAWAMHIRYLVVYRKPNHGKGAHS